MSRKSPSTGNVVALPQRGLLEIPIRCIDAQSTVEARLIWLCPNDSVASDRPPLVFLGSEVVPLNGGFFGTNASL